MKKTIAILMFSIMIGIQAAKAAEQPDNPDRYPSIGFTYTGIDIDGTLTAMSSGFTADQGVGSKQGILEIDGRIPVSGTTTLIAAVGFLKAEDTFDETNVLNGAKSDVDGISIKVGVRFYFKQ